MDSEGEIAETLWPFNNVVPSGKRASDRQNRISTFRFARQWSGRYRVLLTLRCCLDEYREYTTNDTFGFFYESQLVNHKL